MLYTIYHIAWVMYELNKRMLNALCFYQVMYDWYIRCIQARYIRWKQAQVWGLFVK